MQKKESKQENLAERVKIFKVYHVYKYTEKCVNKVVHC